MASTRHMMRYAGGPYLQQPLVHGVHELRVGQVVAGVLQQGPLQARGAWPSNRCKHTLPSRQGERRHAGAADL